MGARYTIISADTHAGANHATYREYLDPSFHDDFDAWRGSTRTPGRTCATPTCASATGTTIGATATSSPTVSWAK
ncbi:hypothetical protein [Parafrankia sp. CH37]|uniref:hypothetical protein n=1 Tax=Parafrankia sp. CH37 TaxID=683308 RepID=UPI001D016D98|nr:hypothetical protein [Parafrankia sp. CH37]